MSSINRVKYFCLYSAQDIFLERPVLFWRFRVKACIVVRRAIMPWLVFVPGSNTAKFSSVASALESYDCVYALRKSFKSCSRVRFAVRASSVLGSTTASQGYFQCPQQLPNARAAVEQCLVGVGMFGSRFRSFF